MDASPPRSPAENFAALLRGLVQALITRSAWGLGQPLINLIADRIRGINQLFARIAAGRFFPRPHAAKGLRRSARKTPALRLPRTFGWLLPLVPEAIGQRSQLEYLFRDPAMVALMQAAPVPMARALRPLCRMLGLQPPPIIAPPERPRRPRAPRPARPHPLPDTPSQPLPEWLRDRRKPWSLARIRGSPTRG